MRSYINGQNKFFIMGMITNDILNLHLCWDFQIDAEEISRDSRNLLSVVRVKKNIY